MFQITTTLLAALFTLLTSMTTPAPADAGQSLALADDAGVAVLTWDGQTARFYRSGTLVADYEATSWHAAMWQLEGEAQGELRGPRTFDHVLTAAELDAISREPWTASLAPARANSAL